LLLVVCPIAMKTLFCASVGVGSLYFIFCKSAVLVPRKIALFTSLAACFALASCTNTPWAQNLERSLEADPSLGNSSVFGSGSDTSATLPDDRISPSPEVEQTPDGIQLPNNFPGDIPSYPNAELVSVSPRSQASSDVASSDSASSDSASSNSSVIQTRWRTSDAPEQVAQFYREQFQQEGWQVVEPSNADSSSQPLTADRDNVQVRVTVVPTGNAAGVNQTDGATEFIISYRLGDRTTTAQSSPSASPSASPTNSGSPEAFSGVEQAPPELQTYIADLKSLGALTGSSEDGDFAPNQTITRREYARWLVEVNNLIYAKQPSRQIRLGVATDQPAFQDVPTSDADFSAIQGLANAGLIPSPLSGNATEVTFRPDAPLTREDLILWKAPIDSRQALPNATIEAVQQTWGFQDTARISPEALRAVLADFQNGDLSNIRRAFGYTTLFQPQKPVTRAEAAAVLWFFGSQGNGLSAQDALATNRQATGG
jgi:hypothetical protein